MNEIQEIGERLRELRVERNESLEDVARVTGVSKSLLSRYERGLIDPGMKALGKLSKYYSVSLDWLFGFAKSREPINVTNVLDGLTDEKKVEAISFIQYLKNKE